MVVSYEDTRVVNACTLYMDLKIFMPSQCWFLLTMTAIFTKFLNREIEQFNLVILLLLSLLLVQTNPSHCGSVFVSSDPKISVLSAVRDSLGLGKWLDLTVTCIYVQLFELMIFKSAVI